MKEISQNFKCFRVIDTVNIWLENHPLHIIRKFLVISLQRKDKGNEEEKITLTKAPKQSANVLVLTLMAR